MLVAHFAYRSGQMAYREIAEALGMNHYSAVASSIRGLKTLCKENIHIQRLENEIQQETTLNPTLLTDADPADRLAVLRDGAGHVLDAVAIFLLSPCRRRTDASPSAVDAAQAVFGGKAAIDQAINVTQVKYFTRARVGSGLACC